MHIIPNGSNNGLWQLGQGDPPKDAPGDSRKESQSIHKKQQWINSGKCQMIE